MALPNPSSAWKLVKYGLRAAEYAIPAAYAYLESTLTAQEAVTDVGWIRWHVIGTRTSPAGLSEDTVEFKMDFVNITGGQIDTSWSAGDFATMKAAFDTFLTGIKTQLSPALTFTQYRAYRMYFNPADPGPGHRTGAGAGPFAISGPPLYIADISVPCTGTGYMPYQVAASVTLRTAWPRHWGRFYVPHPAPATITTNGRLTATAYQTFAQVTKTLISTLADAEFLCVVPVTDLGKAAFHALLGVSQVVCDDIPDVQRSRRPRQPAIRYVAP